MYKCRDLEGWRNCVHFSAYSAISHISQVGCWKNAKTCWKELRTCGLEQRAALEQYSTAES